MKKFAIMAMLAVAANLMSPLMPAAHAAIADEVLAEIVAQNGTAAQMQELLALRQDIMQGGKEAIVNRVTQAAINQAALSQIGQGELAGVVSAAAAGGDIRAAVEDTVRQQVTAQMAARLGPYGDSVSLLIELLQNGTLASNASGDNVALADNYRQILAQVLK